jgi:signal transduction histidine kinase/FixJ family two-component response regulator/CheY-like chemotaxis protein
VVERKLNISIISASRELTNTLTDLIKESVDFIKISAYLSESSFLEKTPGIKSDVIISDATENVSDWRSFHGKITDINPDILLIFIVSDGQKELVVEMIKAGVYDIISPSSLARIQPLVHRIIRDIDDKANLRYLSKEKDFSDHITNSSRSMLSIINKDYVYEKVNTTFCSAHNVAVESIVGKSLSEVWGRDTFESKIQQNIDLCFAGNTVRYEANFITPIFGNRFYEVVFRPISKGSGEITHLLAETFDITDLRLSQKIVNEMEDEFKKLETNLPIGFLRCDPEGTIIHANKAFLKIMECDDEASIAGLSINEFYTEKGLVDIHMFQLINDKIKTFGRVPMFTFTGNEIACRISGFIVTNDSGKPLFIDFAFEDSSRELMLENRLLQAQKLETIGALAGGLAHDFNNILATIFGYSEMLLEEVPKTTPSSEKVLKIITAVTKARSLTNQILTFSRQVEQEKISVSVYEVLNETIGFIESGKPLNIEIDARIVDNDVYVYADPTQLFRVFLNLMTNAIQSMEEKGGTLSVNLAVIEGNLVRHDLNKDIVADEYSLITFEDTGEGMDPSLVQRIFEPYFTTKDVGKGTGLGLSVVHGIISEIEGEILISSKMNKGSVFSVYLPVSREYNEKPGKDQDSKNLLFITGNRYESRVLSIALERSGYKLLYASDRSRFFNIMSDKTDIPDLIIYMDDSEEISADDMINLYTKQKIITPLILISDTEQFLSKEKLVNSGIAKQLLNKPVSLKEIRNAIQMSLI